MAFKALHRKPGPDLYKQQWQGKNLTFNRTKPSTEPGSYSGVAPIDRLGWGKEEEKGGKTRNKTCIIHLNTVN